MQADVHHVAIDANVLWNVFRSASSPLFIAVCDDLNLSLEADSEEELKSLIPEAMNLLMSDLLADHEIEAYLDRKGWGVRNPPTKPGVPVAFDISFRLVAGERPIFDLARVSH